MTVPKTVILVHGYSVRSLSTYGQLPELFVSEGIQPEAIQISAFDSLDNSVTCDDLAAALEDRVAELEAAGVDVADTAIVTHSTGAMIARRWILDRVAGNKPLPSHFVSLAGATHGSTLAHLGQSILNRLRQDLSKANGIGQQVLTDLDYGSAFLRRVDAEWLDAAKAGNLDNLFCFSIVGDDHSELQDEVFWQAHEPGSDSTVRIAGANFNYTWLEADPYATPPVIKSRAAVTDVAFLVLHGYSHTGKTGIIDSVTTTRDAPFAAIMDAFRVVDKASYDALRTTWSQAVAAWNAANSADCCSMIVFRFVDESGRPIPDNVILLYDLTGTPTQLQGMQDHQPIQNAVDGSVISFYLNFPAFTGDPAAPINHGIRIEAKSGSPLIDYEGMDYVLAPDVLVLVRPNEVTYVDVAVKRDVSAIYRVIAYSTGPDMTKQWPPLPA